MGANAYGQLVNIIIQLVSLPVFLSHWDLKTYGMWLTLSAIPAYLSMADIGMVSVAGTRMTILNATGDFKTSNQVFQSAQFFVGMSCLIIAVIALPIILMIPMPALQIPGASETLIALTLIVLISMANGLSGSVFRSTHRYALGTFLDTNTRLLEWIGGLVGFFWIGTFFSVAAGMLLVRTLMAFTLAFISTKGISHLKWGTKQASLNEVKKMINPSLGYMSFPISNALSFQGFTLLAAATLGPVAVAIFNIYRTVARVVVQITSVFSHALSPELSRLYGNGSHVEFRKLASRSTVIGLGGALLFSTAIFFASPFLLEFWTKGKVSFIPGLMALFLVYAAIAGSWHIPRIVLISTNGHSRLGLIALVVSIAALAFAWMLSKKYNIEGLIIAMTAGEICISAASIWLYNILIKNTQLKK
ncbi:MAG: hypothetical protein CVU21_14725 [Betaproteobacteria bacterium HGW-Betaproteobacteria-15]|nr:MAG: hypothetical protein CVU21_14725 [Betaproteobacteria bacterium HGW-Betaproteobacteria-15]